MNCHLYSGAVCNVDNMPRGIAQDDNVAEEMPLNITETSSIHAITTFRDKAIDCSALEQRIVASHDSSLILRTMFRLIKSGNFEQIVQAKPDVVFSDEASIDADGLTRELCHMIMASMRDGKGGIALFEGKIDHLVPIHSQEYVGCLKVFHICRKVDHPFSHTCRLWSGGIVKSHSRVYN